MDFDKSIMKQKLLQSGYRHEFLSDLYVNPVKKRKISEEAIEDHNQAWLDEQLESVDDVEKWILIGTFGAQDVEN